MRLPRELIYDPNGPQTDWMYYRDVDANTHIVGTPHPWVWIGMYIDVWCPGEVMHGPKQTSEG